MRYLTALVTRRPVSALTVWIGLIVLGLVSLAQLPVEMMPSVDLREIVIVTEYDSMPPQEIETLVTVPIEDALASVSGVRSMESISVTGRSTVLISFDWGIDPLIAATETRERVDSVFPLLPHGATRPLVISRNSADQPLMTISVVPELAFSMRETSRLVRDNLVPVLRRQPGVAAVLVVGGVGPQITVDVDPYRLHTAGLNLHDLCTVVAAAVMDRPAGRLVTGSVEQRVRVRSNIEGVADLSGIPIQPGSAALRLTDVSRVSIGDAVPHSFFLSGSQQAVGLLVYKDGGTGSPAAASAVRDTIDQLRHQLRGDARIIIEHEAAVEVERAVRGLFVAIGLGVAASVAVLALVFQDSRVVIITALSIPVSIVVSFLVLHATETSLNVVSLSGIAVGVGMIVDNSIVIVTRLATEPRNSFDAVASAALDMLSSTVGSTITSLLVFVPVLFVPGLVGALFSQLAIAIAALLLIAFLCSATFAPALWMLLSPPAAIRPPPAAARRPARPIWSTAAERYRRLLPGLIASNRWPVGLYLLALATTIALFLHLPKAILAEPETRELHIAIEFPRGISIAASQRATAELVDLIADRFPLSHSYAFAGSTGSAPLHQPLQGGGPITIYTRIGPDRTDPVPEMLSAIRQHIGPEVDVRVSSRRSAVHRTLAGDTDGMVIHVQANDYDLAKIRAERLIGHLRKRYPDRRFVLPADATAPTLLLHFDSAPAAMVGLSARAAGGQLRAGIDGVHAGDLSLSGERHPIIVRTDPRMLDSASGIERLLLSSRTATVPLSTVGTVGKQWSPTERFRSNRLATVVLPIGPHVRVPDFAVPFARPIARSRLFDAAAELARVFALALILMFLVLAAQFNSAGIALLLIAVLPLSVVGSLIALTLIGGSLNLHSVLGILILLGTTMNTTILLTAGATTGGSDQLIRTCEQRIVPVLATTLTTVAALFPLAVFQTRSETGQTAVAVIGGLFIGTILVLTIYPALLQRLVGPRSRR